MTFDRFPNLLHKLGQVLPRLKIIICALGLKCIPRINKSNKHIFLVEDWERELYVNQYDFVLKWFCFLIYFLVVCVNV